MLPLIFFSGFGLGVAPDRLDVSRLFVRERKKDETKKRREMLVLGVVNRNLAVLAPPNEIGLASAAAQFVGFLLKWYQLEMSRVTRVVKTRCRHATRQDAWLLSKARTRERRTKRVMVTQFGCVSLQEVHWTRKV